MFTVAEVAAGVARLSRLGAAKRAEQYDTWLHHLIASTGDRVLAFDTRVARATGELLDLATARGKHPGFADVAIAATASVHGLTVLTANVRHFEPLGVAHADPFAALPG